MSLGGLLMFMGSTAAQASLPYLEDYQFTPEVATILYGSPTDHYKLAVQFFGQDKNNITGRFCEIDDNHKPFNCISVRPDPTSRACILSPYKENDFRPYSLRYTDLSIHPILFFNGVTGKARDPVNDELEKLKLDDKGSAKATGVPAQMVIPFVDKIEQARDEWVANFSMPTANAIYHAKIACNEYFKQAGIAGRFENSRKINLEFCDSYNESAKRLGSKLNNCEAEAGKSRNQMKARKTSQ